MFDFPEAALFPTARASMDAIKAAYWAERVRLVKVTAVPAGLVVLVFMILLVAPLRGFLMKWFGSLTTGASCVLIPLVVLSGAVWYGGFRAFVREPMRKRLRASLRSHGLLLCIHCGYDLRGVGESRCPECGDAFTKPQHSPSLDPTQTEWKPWTKEGSLWSACRKERPVSKLQWLNLIVGVLAVWVSVYHVFVPLESKNVLVVVVFALSGFMQITSFIRPRWQRRARRRRNAQGDE
jgi:peptidoglycan/LPS O-acetylase OafA/YrhL